MNSNVNPRGALGLPQKDKTFDISPHQAQPVCPMMILRLKSMLAAEVCPKRGRALGLISLARLRVSKCQEIALESRQRVENPQNPLTNTYEQAGGSFLFSGTSAV